MKRLVTLSVCVLASTLMVTPLLYSDDPAEPTPALTEKESAVDLLPSSCQQYPLQYLGNGNYLYYSHYHASSCSSFTTDYIIGNYYWPATCDVNCVGSPARTTAFSGLKEKIQKDHKVFPVDLSDPSEYTNVLPPGPARLYGKEVNIPPNRVYLTHTFNGLGETDPRFFKVFGIRHQTGFPGKPDVIYYALELGTDPSPSATNNIDSLTALSGDKAYRGKIRVTGGSAAVDVLILLH